MNRPLLRRSFLRMFGGIPFTGLLASRAAAAETYTMRLSLPNPVSSEPTLAALRFASAVARRSNGQLKIEVYPIGQLAKEQESIDGLTTGVIDFTIQASGFLVQLFPRYQVFDMPFLFRDSAASSRVLDGSIGNQFFAELESRGIIGLGWGTNGFKEIETTSKAVVVPEDMKGLRIRIVGGPVFVATYQALGAIPVAIDLSEVLTALSQRTIDGIDVAIAGFTSGNYYTVCRHVAMSNHVSSAIPLMASKRKIEALPSALQKIVREEAKVVVASWRSATALQTANGIQMLKNNGVTFTEIEYPAFRRAMAPVYASVQSKLGDDLLDRIARATGS
jgi:TRAP-type transport system periplasmic protein